MRLKKKELCMDNSENNKLIETKWIGFGIAVCFSLSVVSFITGIGILGGFFSFGLMGLIVGYASPGNAVKEAGIAGFIVASLGFIVNNIIFTIIGVGFVVAVAYGFVALIIATIGGHIGEKL